VRFGSKNTNDDLKLQIKTQVMEKKVSHTEPKKALYEILKNETQIHS
jgi:hypothetical protein